MYKNIEDRKAYHRKWYRANIVKRRADIKTSVAKRRQDTKSKVIDYLRVRACVDCGESDIIVLEFDHTEDNKSYGVSEMIGNGMKWESVLKEIEKCEVVCANCHRRRTASRSSSYRNMSLSSSLV